MFGPGSKEVKLPLSILLPHFSAQSSAPLPVPGLQKSQIGGGW